MAHIQEDENFTKLCSSVTVLSEEQGFFAEFYQCVSDAGGEKWVTQVFGKLKTDREKILALYNDPNVCDIVLGTLEHVKPVYKQKDAKFSLQRRNTGDLMLKNGDLKSALLMYSQAVMRSPATGVEKIIDGGFGLPIALWCRSRVLLEMGDGGRALTDLQYAVKNKFPIKHKSEYFWRMAKCYSQMGEIEKARVSFGLAEKLLGDDTDAITLVKEDLRVAEETAEENKAARVKTPEIPQLTNGESEEVKGASSLLKLENSKSGNDRFMVAGQNVHTGDTVLTEQPQAACLLPKFFGTHCYECLARLVAPIGCPDCSGIAFCSVECKEIACSTYHKFECKYLDLLVGSGMSILCHVALRLILQTQNDDKRLNDLKLLLDGLCKHSEMRKSHDYLQRGLMTSFLLRFLQHCQFFGRRTTESVEPIKKEIVVGELLLGLLQALQHNAHEIYETKLGEKHRIVGSKPIYVGVGIYKTGSLFNHDCNPGVARTFVGKTIIYNAVRPVSVGEMLAENYGPIYTMKNLVERQRSLKSRYWFKCECKACTENWPKLAQLEGPPRYKCPTNGCSNTLVHPKQPYQPVKCLKCKQRVNLEESIDFMKKVKSLYQEAAELMDEEKTKEAIALFSQGIDLFYSVAAPPHRETAIAQESLRVCFADQGTTVKI